MVRRFRVEWVLEKWWGCDVLQRLITGKVLQMSQTVLFAAVFALFVVILFKLGISSAGLFCFFWLRLRTPKTTLLRTPFCKEVWPIQRALCTDGVLPPNGVRIIPLHACPWDSWRRTIHASSGD